MTIFNRCFEVLEKSAAIVRVNPTSDEQLNANKNEVGKQLQRRRTRAGTSTGVAGGLAAGIGARNLLKGKGRLGTLAPAVGMAGGAALGGVRDYLTRRDANKKLPVAAGNYLSTGILRRAQQRALEGASKSASVIESVGKALTTPIKGTKPWLIGRGQSAVSGVRKAVRSAPPVNSARRTSSGAYDVSALAKKMGVT